jgi:hypothetical protein
MNSSRKKSCEKDKGKKYKHCQEISSKAMFIEKTVSMGSLTTNVVK